MKKFVLLFTIILTAFSFDSHSKKRWVSIFDGKTLDGWKVGANAQTFKVEDGAIVVNGNVAHLYYDGLVGQHNFKNFEFKADVKTMPGSNSGIYFHTMFQESSWPKKGYEVQINNSHTDWRRTAGLYAVQDVKVAPAKDEEWFTVHIKVKGKQITVKVAPAKDEEWFTIFIKVKGKQVIVKVDDKLITNYTEPADVKREAGMAGRLLSSGTIALQGHDPKSKVYYKNIMVKVLGD